MFRSVRGVVVTTRRTNHKTASDNKLITISKPPSYAHRDLKPANMVIDDATGTTKLVDFGVSQKLEKVQKFEKLRRNSSARAGDESYTHEEQAEKDGQQLYLKPESEMWFESKADLWAVGVTLFELFFRVPLFSQTMEIDDIK